MLTSRERLLCTLSGGIPDRVPVSFFVQEEFLSWYYPKRENIRRLEEAVDCARELECLKSRRVRYCIWLHLCLLTGLTLALIIHDLNLFSRISTIGT